MGVLLLHDNAPVQKARLSTTALHSWGFSKLNHQPYSQDFAPNVYFLFPKNIWGKNDEDSVSMTYAVEVHFEDKLRI